MFLSCTKMQNVVLVGRNCNLSVLGRVKPHHICFGSRKVAQIFRSRKVTAYHFESQWPQHTFFGSRKVASYLFWLRKIAQLFRSHKVATYPFLSRNGCNRSPRPRSWWKSNSIKHTYIHTYKM